MVPHAGLSRQVINQAEALSQMKKDLIGMDSVSQSGVEGEGRDCSAAVHDPQEAGCSRGDQDTASPAPCCVFPRENGSPGPSQGSLLQPLL